MELGGARRDRRIFCGLERFQARVADPQSRSKRRDVAPERRNAVALAGAGRALAGFAEPRGERLSGNRPPVKVRLEIPGARALLRAQRKCISRRLVAARASASFCNASASVFSRSRAAAASAVSARFVAVSAAATAVARSVSLRRSLRRPFSIASRRRAAGVVLTKT